MKYANGSESVMPRGPFAQLVAIRHCPCSDGVARLAYVGVPDTYFSAPARVVVRGRTVTGFVTFDSGNNYSGTVEGYTFHANRKGKNADALPSEFPPVYAYPSRSAYDYSGPLSPWALTLAEFMAQRPDVLGGATFAELAAKLDASPDTGGRAFLDVPDVADVLAQLYNVADVISFDVTRRPDFPFTLGIMWRDSSRRQLAELADTVTA